MLLYRYQPINKFTLENLIQKKNWATNPVHFNDPFEFSLRSNISITEEGKILYLTPEKNEIREGIKKIIAKYGVVSYSINHTSSLLWSHYSNHHKGICLGFDVNEDKLENLFKVKYENIIPQLNFEEEEDFREVLVTKSKVWSYENEYRQIFRQSEFHVDYPGELKEIIFGCQTSSKDIDTIFKICDTVYNNKIYFWKLFIQQDTFSLGSAGIERKVGDQVPKWWDGKLTM